MSGPYKVCTLKKTFKKKSCDTNNDSSSSDSSTCNNENSILTDDEFNMKMPAVVRKKSSLITKVSDAVKIDLPEDSDGSESTSLL